MTSPPDPRLLATFVVLAEELHFGRAAERLYLAQPAVTQRIQRLERQLGVKLVERSRHEAALTPAGTAVLPYARQAVAAAEAVGRAAAAAERGHAVVRLGLSPGVHYLAERALADVHATAPDVRVSALADNTGVVVREVAAGRLDVGLGFAARLEAGVRRELLCEEPAVVAVAPAHRLAARERVSLRELAAETFALVDPEGGEGYNAAVAALCERAGFRPALVRQPTGPMAWEAAVRRRGCVGLTTRVSAASTLRGIRTLHLEEDVRFRIDLLWPETLAAPPPAVELLASAARRAAAR